MRQCAMVFEAIIHDMIDMNGWLGDNATAKKASLYDDLVNGIDEIVEFMESDTSATTHLALGVDITFGTDVINKLDKIKDQIEKGDLGVIKYLLTDTYRGEMKNVPKAVIGCDMKNLNEITKFWLEGKKKVLAQHRAKFMILDQIMMQLNNFAQYAEKVSQPVIAGGFNRVLKIVEKIWDEELVKLPGGEKDLSFSGDRVYNTIREYCEELNKENLQTPVKK